MPVTPVDASYQPAQPMPSVVCAGTRHQRDPPFFSGRCDHDVEDWLSSYERVSSYIKGDDFAKLKSVNFYLTGVTERWYRNREAVIKTWSDFKTSFAQDFGRPAVQKLRAEQRLRGRAQQPGENFTSYI